MRSLLLILTFLVFLTWTSIARYGYVCKIKNGCGLTETIAEVEYQRPKTLNLMYQDLMLLDGYEQFSFKSNDIKPNLTINNNAFLDELADYINLNEERQVIITGLFRESEENFQSDNFGDIGQARAASIRGLLMDRGVAEEHISLDSNPIEGEALLEPITFQLIDPTAVEADQ